MPYVPQPEQLYQELQELRQQVTQLLTQSPLGNSSITRGGLRVASNEGILVQGSQKVEGWLVVTGTERVTGTLEILGRLVASGAIELTGNTDITGPTAITGDTDITGRLKASGAIEFTGPMQMVGDMDVTGDVSLKGRMAVEEGGRVSVTGPDGDTVLAASKMTFANGATLDANGGTGAALRAGAYTAVAAAGVASIGSMGRRFEVDGFYDGPRVVGMATILKSERPNNEVGDLVATSDGVIRRVVAI